MIQNHRLQRFSWRRWPQVAALICACALPIRAADSLQCLPLSISTNYKFSEPILFRELPTERGTFLVGELGGDVYSLTPSAGSYVLDLFGHVPVSHVYSTYGLLGLAFHPDFKNNHKYYVYYMQAAGLAVLEERTTDSTYKKDAGTARTLFTVSLANTSGHFGGDLHFGQDGYLYLGLGDDGSPNVYSGNAQSLQVLLGKMLRIDVDNKQGNLEYAIPSDNPFYGDPDTTVRQEIFAYGLRNPWRWSFDPLNGKLMAGDVGGYVQEEVDIVQNGRNYGWNIMEGNTCLNLNDELTPLATCDTTGLTPPIATVDHVPIAAPQWISTIIGGYVYRGNPASRFYGTYFFGDHVYVKLYALSGGVVSEVGKAPTAMSAFGTDSAGNIYMVGYGNGIIYKLENPDFQTSVRQSQPALQSRVLSRIGGKWWFNSDTFPGLEEFHVVDMQGKDRLFLNREKLSQGYAADLPAGIYAIMGQEKGRRQSFLILLQ